MNIKTIAVLVIGIIIGISFSNLFKGCNNTANQNISVKTLRPSVIKKESEKANKIYQHKIDSLKISSTSLAKKLAVTKQTLSDVLKKNTALQMQVYDLIDYEPINADSRETNHNCDSLKVSVSELLRSDNIKDSLFAEANLNLEQQVKNKDSTLIIKDMEIQGLKISFDESILHQQLLYDQNKSYQKQFRQQKVKGKLLSVGALILSGMAAAYLIQQ